MSERELRLLLKHYSALSPGTPSLIPTPRPFPPPRCLSLPRTQQWIVENLIPIDREVEARGGRVWKKGFWKRVVKGIEDGFEERRKERDPRVEDEEVEEEILERMVEFLSSSEGSTTMSERRYWWGDLERGSMTEWQSVRTREDERLISSGTTGLRTWQACIALANHFLADSKPLRQARNIVELGAGVGLLSLIAATLTTTTVGDTTGGGGTTIVATDVDEKVLELLDANVRLNELKGNITTSKLDWQLASDLDSHQGELLEWEHQAFGARGERANLVIGADIVYDPALTAPLASTLAWLLRPRVNEDETQAQAIIAGTIRNESTWELFLEECRSRELRIEDVELKRFDDGSGLVGAEGWEGEGVVRVVRLTTMQ